MEEGKPQSSQAKEKEKEKERRGEGKSRKHTWTNEIDHKCDHLQRSQYKTAHRLDSVATRIPMLTQMPVEKCID